MKNQLNILFFLFLGGISMLSSAQELTVSQQNDLKEKVRQSAQKTQTIVSDFEQVKYLDVLQNDITSKGKLVFKQPDLIKWEYITPEKSIAVFKNEKLFVRQVGKNDTYDLGSNKMFRSLSALIAGSLNGNMFDDTKFKISYFSDTKGYRVMFVPRDKRLLRFISSFQLKFKKDTAEVTEVILNEPNGDFTRITFQNKKINAAVDEGAFKL
jgi:outer membrane lipoprotein-sorting protein